MRDDHAEMNKRVQYTWLKETLAQHEPTFIDMDQCHQAAVCIPLLKNTSDGSYDVLFEVRAATIAHQPGDVCCMPAGGRGERRGAAGKRHCVNCRKNYC